MPNYGFILKETVYEKLLDLIKRRINSLTEKAKDLMIQKNKNLCNTVHN